VDIYFIQFFATLAEKMPTILDMYFLLDALLARKNSWFVHLEKFSLNFLISPLVIRVNLLNPW